MKLISRKKAIEKGLPRYFTGIPCCRGHITERLTSIRGCIDCRKTYSKNYSEQKKKYYILNREKILKKVKKYTLYNKKTIAKYQKNYQKINSEKLSKYNKNYRKTYIETERIHRKFNIRKFRNTPEGKLISNMRSRMYSIFKLQKLKKPKTIDMLGCNGIFLRQYIQRRFKKGMSWNNYGKWHIDHIIPIDYFVKKCDFNSLQIQKKCFNYKNLKPEWAEYNLQKGAKLI